MNDNIKKIIDNPKIKTVIVVCGLIGIVLIFLSTFIDSGSNSDKKDNKENIVIKETEILSTYKENTEVNLGNMIASIEGAGKTKIMVTVDSSIEYVYATDDKNSDTSRKSGANLEIDESKDNQKEELNVVLRSSNGEEQLVTVKEIQPKVRGVLVICEGGDNIEVEQRVLEAVTKSLDISTARVCVTKLSK